VGSIFIKYEEFQIHAILSLQAHMHAEKTDSNGVFGRGENHFPGK